MSRFEEGILTIFAEPDDYSRKTSKNRLESLGAFDGLSWVT
jgi:hypothetical protein